MRNAPHANSYAKAIAEEFIAENPELRRPFDGAVEYADARHFEQRGAVRREEQAIIDRSDAKNEELAAKNNAARYLKDLGEDQQRAFDQRNRNAEAKAETTGQAAKVATQRSVDARDVENTLIHYAVQLKEAGAKPVPKPVKTKGHSIEGEVAAQKGWTKELELAREAGPTEAEHEAQVRKNLADLKAEGEQYPKVLLHGDAASLRWPVTNVSGQPDQYGRFTDPVALNVSLHHDQLLARALAQVRAYHAGNTDLCLSAEDKKRRIADLRAKILQSQHIECALRIEMAGDNPEIAFRPECSPLAILGVEGPAFRVVR